MRRTTRAIASALAAALLALALAGCGTSTRRGQPSPTSTPSPSTQPSTPATSSAPATSTTEASGTVFVARLTPLNGSGVTGNATVTVEGTSGVNVEITAMGLEAGREHEQHIHGFRNGTPAKAAPMDATLTDQQAEAIVGPPLLALEPYPEGGGPKPVTYRATFQDVSLLFPLDARAIELHGLTRGGEYDFTIPVATGLLQAAGAQGAGPGIESSPTTGQGLTSTPTPGGTGEATGSGTP
jgi:hypothetical protein